MSQNSAVQISIVTTLYRSAPFLDEFVRECLAALDAIGCKEYEFVFVNDGSPDDSLQRVLEMRKTVPHMTVVDFSRNFGHHNAMLAGIRYARGSLVFLIDCDLEVRPAVLGDLYRKYSESGADMVYGYQETRKGLVFERLSGGMFWTFFNMLSETKVPENIVTERLMSRRFIDALLELGDKNLFLGGMMSWTGFEQIGIPVKKGLRATATTYTPLKKLRLTVNAISSFSSQPLTWMFTTGLTITLLSFLFFVYLVARKLLFDDTLLGFTSIMAMITLAIGITTTSLGVVGIYLGKIFNQVQSRPHYIVRDVYR